MLYFSTRDRTSTCTMNDVLLTPLSPDGGLYLPEIFPHFPPHVLTQKTLSYPDIFLQCCSPYVTDLSRSEIEACIAEAYDIFPSNPAPLRPLEEGHFLLELFHGPSFSFKDFAMRFVSALTVAVLEKQAQASKAVVLCATSGDTGAAALSAFSQYDNVPVIVLYPHKGVAPLQERQMHALCTQKDAVLPIDGSFDDCQHLLKGILLNNPFGSNYQVMTVNSINWFRILAQSVYYFWTVYQLHAMGYEEPPSITIPTGNFGNAFAGYVAKSMGLSLGKSIIATNSNHILEQAIQEGLYQPRSVIPTHSPSMDIQIASNFERLLFMSTYGDDLQTKLMMENLADSHSLAIPAEQLTFMREHFDAYYTTEEQTLETIRHTYEEYGILIDPHTAVGVHASRQRKSPLNVTFATAHPGKFPEATKKACSQIAPLPLPPSSFTKAAKVYSCQKSDIIQRIASHIHSLF